MKLLFKAAGEGPVLVLLHGFPLSSSMWYPNFARLRERNLLVAVSLRGFGGSSVAASASMAEMADDVVETLDALGIRRAAFCGLSMGGYVAFELWKRHRARVSALVLADTRAAADTEEQRAGRATFAAEVVKGGSAVAGEKMMPKLLSAKAPEAARVFVRDIIAANKPEGLAAALLGLGSRADSTSLLATIDVPALVVCGALDEISPPAEMRAMGEKIAGAKYVEIPDAGHLSNVEAPGPFNDAVSGFMGTVPE
ncbi:MAG: alpha/beta fold hydrolase [Planctomycetota bacterium]